MPTYQVTCVTAKALGYKAHEDFTVYVPEGQYNSIEFYCERCAGIPTLKKKDLPSKVILCYFGQYKRRLK